MSKDVAKMFGTSTIVKNSRDIKVIPTLISSICDMIAGIIALIINPKIKIPASVFVFEKTSGNLSINNNGNASKSINPKKDKVGLNLSPNAIKITIMKNIKMFRFLTSTLFTSRILKQRVYLTVSSKQFSVMFFMF